MWALAGTGERPESPTMALMKWLNEVKWDAQGLVPVIAQEQGTGDVLMFAWMNREALAKTAELGRAVYFSRSRKKLWFKGEESGHVQTVHEMRIDCDNDVVLLKITQEGHDPGIACHTGRHSCFYSVFKDGQWLAVDPVLNTHHTTVRDRAMNTSVMLVLTAMCTSAWP